MENLKNTLEHFNTSIEQLKEAERKGKEIEQNHFGDFLMIREESPTFERYRVWLNHPDNISQGTPVIEIEYAGEQNAHTWETITKLYSIHTPKENRL